MNLQTRLLLAIGAVMLLVFAIVGYQHYQLAHTHAEQSLKAQAEKVHALLMSYRNTQQQVFLDHKVPLTEVTLRFLPAFAVGKISENYSRWDDSGFSFNNVSDQPRNPDHIADAVELDAMSYFRDNPQDEVLFKSFKTQKQEDYYLYARPIWIEEHCLKCHSNREDAPPTISKRYDTAWNYQLGDLRGLLSVKLPATTVKQQAWDSFKQGLLIQATGFMLIFLLVMWFIRRYVGCPLRELADSMKAVSEGHYAHRIEGFAGEFAVLGTAFNEMTQQVEEHQKALRTLNSELEQRVAQRTADLEQANHSIKHLNQQLKSENVRMGAELAVTHHLQQILLPRQEDLQVTPKLDIAAYMLPATEIGGDYYDVLQQGNDIKIAIGDVTGHGLESGVLMLMVQTAVRTLLSNGVTEPKKILDVLNRAIFANVQRMHSDKNLTLMLMDYQDGTLRLSGQHEELLVVRQTGDVERIDTIDLGFIIGLEPEIDNFLHEKEIRLNAGDNVVLYTDGLTEAQNAQQQQYSVERLIRLIQANVQHSAQDLVNLVVDDVQQHMGEQESQDDITLLIIKQV